MSLLPVLFHQQNRVSVFEILIFSQHIWGNVHYVPQIRPGRKLGNHGKSSQVK